MGTFTLHRDWECDECHDRFMVSLAVRERKSDGGILPALAAHHANQRIDDEVALQRQSHEEWYCRERIA